jgi:hypothetical protein
VIAGRCSSAGSHTKRTILRISTAQLDLPSGEEDRYFDCHRCLIALSSFIPSVVILSVAHCMATSGKSARIGFESNCHSGFFPDRDAPLVHSRACVCMRVISGDRDELLPPDVPCRDGDPAGAKALWDGGVAPKYKVP